MSTFTPGPWEWFCHPGGDVYLGTPDRGRLIVMDFVRRGMQGAAPRFAFLEGDERLRMGGLMMPVSTNDLQAHPDARIIAAAPDLLAACKAALLKFKHSPLDRASVAADMLREAVAKAEGGSQ